MQKTKEKVESIPDDFKTVMEASDFWDKHDITDYWDNTKEVKFRASLKKNLNILFLRKALPKRHLMLQRKKHVSIETLVNLWLKEKLSAAR